MIFTTLINGTQYVELEELQRVINIRHKVELENNDLMLQIYELQNENRGLDATIDEMNNKFEDKLSLLNDENQKIIKTLLNDKEKLIAENAELKESLQNEIFKYERDMFRADCENERLLKHVLQFVHSLSHKVDGTKTTRTEAK
jgi:hypothetical protein